MNEVIPQLFDQIQTIADQYKSGICHTLVSDNTLYKHNHCQRFTASLGMPNDAAPVEAVILTVDTTHRIFNTKELLIAGNFLNATIIQNVKTNNIKQAPFAEHGHNSSVLLCDMAVIYIAFGSIGLPLHIFFVPLAVELLLCSGSSVFHGFRIHGNGQLRKLKQLRNIIRLPVADILLHALFHIYAGLLTFDHNQRNAIDQQNNIRPGVFSISSLYRELVRNLPDVLIRLIPVNIGNIEGLSVAVIQMHIAALTINQPVIDRFAGKHQTSLQRSIQFTDCLADSIIREWRLLATVNEGL